MNSNEIIKIFLLSFYNKIIIIFVKKFIVSKQNIFDYINDKTAIF